MLGAIAGDIIGSVFEGEQFNTDRTDFELFVPGDGRGGRGPSSGSRFTDDSVCTVAIADALIEGNFDFRASLVKWYDKEPLKFRDLDSGEEYSLYGKFYRAWCESGGSTRGKSGGNGAAMRVSPVSWAFRSIWDVLECTETQAAITHNDVNAIDGAQVVAGAIYLARNCGGDKTVVEKFVAMRMGYKLDYTARQLIEQGHSPWTCQASVGPAIRAFLNSSDWEHAVRLAVAEGGDSDTIASMTGAIAEAFYGGVPEHIRESVLQRITPEMRAVVERFEAKFLSK